MSFESVDLRTLADFDGNVELLRREIVWGRKCLHVLDGNVMEVST